MENDLIMLVKVDGQRVEGEEAATGKHVEVTVTPERAEMLKTIMAEAGQGENIDADEISDTVGDDAVEPDSPAFLTKEAFHLEEVGNGREA